MKSMRALTIRLGDLAVPVELVNSVSEPASRFRLLHDDCDTPTSRRIYCAADELVLEETDIVPAFEISKGEFVKLEKADLDALKPPDTSRVEITGFVDAALDPMLVRKRYHLAPSSSSVGKRAYRLLAETMHDLDVAALARFRAWNSEQLAAIQSRGTVLELATLNVLDDVVDASQIGESLADVKVADVERDLMRQIVERYTRPLQPDDLASLDRPRILAYIDAKIAGGATVEPHPEPVVDERPPLNLELALKNTLRSAPKKKRRRATATA